MENKKNLSFSKEVAETLGIECAIILNLFKNNKLGNISTYEDLQNSLKKELSFIDDTLLNDSINKLISFNLIDLDKSEAIIQNNFTPNKNIESRQLDSNWDPSSETLDIINTVSYTHMTLPPILIV